MKKRILSILLALALLCGSMAGLGMTAAAADADFGWDAMQGDVAMRVTQDGVVASNLVVGEVYQLQIWIQNIGPYSIALPIGWDSKIVSVVDTQSHANVPTGRKYSESNAGFRTGELCSDEDYDPETMQYLYWNGEALFTSAEVQGDGYPYLDAEAGVYRLMYYSLSPNTPAEAQMICEISFRVEASGDPNFHIATQRDGEGNYDPAEPEGVSAVIRDDDGTVQTKNYGSKVKITAPKAKTQDELLNPDEDLTEEEEELPEETFELIRAKHLDCFPYEKAAMVSATLERAETDSADSSYALSDAAVSRMASQKRETALVEMPDEIVQQNVYTLQFSMNALETLKNAAVSELYIETPWAYVGFETAGAWTELSGYARASLTVKPSGNGISVRLMAGGREITGFSSAALRVILPYSEEESQMLLPIGKDVFRGGAENQPMNLFVRDEATQTLKFSASTFCAYRYVTVQSVSYTDTETVSWAKESIDELSKRRVLSGVGGGRFAPNDAVTREQFAKMLVTAFGLYCADANASFRDVQSGSWCAPYVASAAEMGVVSGVGGGRFGTGQQITRQDLAVMVYRALCALGVSFDETTAQPFADDDSISAYAKEAVYALSAAGVIGGVGEGRFAPKASATRAQAAKIIYGVLTLAQRAA